MAGAYLPETMANPETARSQEPTEASFQKAFGVEGTRWDYLDNPENLLSFRRYGAAMVGSRKMQPPNTIVEGEIHHVLSQCIVC